VAIYPKEGTFWHDNPYIVLKGSWVTDDERKAAAVFRDYLLQPDSQQAAMTLGFRPANTSISYRQDPFTQANGVDPDQPKTTLQVPQPKVLEDVKNAWGDLRKEANIMLVLDVSPSMDDQDKLTNALAGIKVFLDQTRDVDRVGFAVFDSEAHLLVPIDKLANTRSQILQYVNDPSLLPRLDSTAIYDGVAAGLDELDRLNDHQHINAIVLLTDGQDNSSSTFNKRDVPNRLRANRDQLWAVKLFPIAYGSGADVDTQLMQEFADITQTSLATGDPNNIKQIYNNMSNYF
jgi:Ca-activated chloride channel family protein